MTVPEAGNQRFLVCAQQISFQDICDVLRSRFPELSKRTPLGKPGTSSLPPGAYTKVKELLGVSSDVLKRQLWMPHVACWI